MNQDTAARGKSSAQLLVEQRGPILLLTISNPEARNALGPEIYAGALPAITSPDPSVRAIVLTGADGVFCGGGNLNRLRDTQQHKTPAHQAESIENLHKLTRAMRTCPRPVIAAVEGPAAGAGFSLALSCDMIVAAEDAKFVMAYVKIGVSPDGGGSYSLANLLPRQLAFELLATGDAIGAPRLHTLGVVNQVTPPGGALDAAMQVASRLAHGASLAQARIKRLIGSAAEAHFSAHLDLERDNFAQALFEPEAREGIAAFLEKRKPDFIGKA
jgi:enoyl-CoA hydratase/carnithine racemase